MRVNVRRANFTTKPCIENLYLRKFIYLNAQDSCFEKNNRAQRISQTRRGSGPLIPSFDCLGKQYSAPFHQNK